MPLSRHFTFYATAGHIFTGAFSLDDDALTLHSLALTSKKHFLQYPPLLVWAVFEKRSKFSLSTDPLFVLSSLRSQAQLNMNQVRVIQALKRKGMGVGLENILKREELPGK